MSRLPLALDLDGTLLRVDTLQAGLRALLRRRPATGALSIAWWFLRGRPYLKARIAALNLAPLAGLPANHALVAYAAAAAAAGRTVVLATAADAAVARAAQARFPFIAEVFASDGRTLNLKGARKAAALRTRFPDGFVYAGDSWADLAVWRHARGAIYAGRSKRLGRRLARITTIEARFPAAD